MTKNRDELLQMLRSIRPDDKVNQKKVRNGFIFLIIGCIFITVIYFQIGFFELINSYLSPLETVIVYVMFFLPFILLGLVIDRYLKKSLQKTLTIKTEYIKESNSDWFMYLIILPFIGIYLYLLAYSEGFFRNVLLVINTIIFVIIFLIVFPFTTRKRETMINKTSVDKDERYIIKNKDGKPHLYKENFLGDEELGELHKKFGDVEETHNILRKNYEIGDKGFFREDRDFIKKDENEQGVLYDPDIYQSFIGDKYLTYKSKKRKK